MINLIQANLQHIQVRECARWSNFGWSAPDPVFSDDLEISYIDSGTRLFQYKDEQEAHQTGDIVFMDCSQQVNCIPGKFSYTSVIIILDNTASDSRATYKQLQKHFHALRCIPSVLFQSDLFSSLFKEMFREFILKSDNYLLRIKLLVLQILVQLQRILNVTSQSKNFVPQRYQLLVSEIITFLSENLDTIVSLEEIGARFNSNPRHLNRIFKNVTGTPIIRYQHQLKIEKAKKLLRNSSMNLLEISLELGFQSSQYLNYYFKKATGITPFEYRKSYATG